MFIQILRCTAADGSFDASICEVMHTARASVCRAPSFSALAQSRRVAAAGRSATCSPVLLLLLLLLLLLAIAAVDHARRSVTPPQPPSPLPRNIQGHCSTFTRRLHTRHNQAGTKPPASQSLESRELCDAQVLDTVACDVWRTNFIITNIGF